MKQVFRILMVSFVIVLMNVSMVDAGVSSRPGENPLSTAPSSTAKSGKYYDISLIAANPKYYDGSMNSVTLGSIRIIDANNGYINFSARYRAFSSDNPTMKVQILLAVDRNVVATLYSSVPGASPGTLGESSTRFKPSFNGEDYASLYTVVNVSSSANEAIRLWEEEGIGHVRQVGRIVRR